jgi:hypothetical protein
LSPSFFQTTFNSFGEPGQEEAHGLVEGNLGNLDHDCLDRLSYQPAGGALPQVDLKPHLRRPRMPQVVA